MISFVMEKRLILSVCSEFKKKKKTVGRATARLRLIQRGGCVKLIIHTQV